MRSVASIASLALQLILLIEFLFLRDTGSEQMSYIVSMHLFTSLIHRTASSHFYSLILLTIR